MKIAVGSENPVKVGAVSAVVARIWPNATVAGLSVESGVSSMPMSDQECRLGAQNRASAALQRGKADLGIGLEAGVSGDSGSLMLLGWVAAIDKDGQVGLGGTARLPLPDYIAQRVSAGEELGDVIDDILGDKGVKRKGGTIGALTTGLVVRQQAFETAVAYALSPFLAPALHNGPG